MRRSAIAACLVLFAGPARADLPPPDGLRFVGFAFRVDGGAKFPDHVLLAYPASDSNGAPQMDYKEVPDGAEVSLGRRGGAPWLYAMKRADYEAWKASYKPTGGYEDPALKALFEGDRVRRCDAQVMPVNTLPTDSPETRVLHTFRVEAIDAGRCHIVATTNAGPPTPEPTAPKPEPTTAPRTEPPRPAGDAAPPASSGGCSLAAGAPGGLLALLLLAGRRRRRST
jgi:hypothetical protein